jgi:hypothetical protein
MQIKVTTAAGKIVLLKAPPDETAVFYTLNRPAQRRFIRRRAGKEIVAGLIYGHDNFYTLF